MNTFILIVVAFILAPVVVIGGPCILDAYGWIATFIFSGIISAIWTFLCFRLA